MLNYGALLEERIEKSNEIYRMRGMALVHKIPVPVKIFKKNKRTGRILDGALDKKSTVDFEGLCHGRSLAFEAKSTSSNTSFPLKNIHAHQMKYLADHLEQGGISFFLIEFAKTGEIYYCKFLDIQHFWDNALVGGRKSIPKGWFDIHCQVIRANKYVALDYLSHAMSPGAVKKSMILN